MTETYNNVEMESVGKQVQVTPANVEAATQVFQAPPSDAPAEEGGVLSTNVNAAAASGQPLPGTTSAPAQPAQEVYYVRLNEKVKGTHITEFKGRDGVARDLVFPPTYIPIEMCSTFGLTLQDIQNSPTIRQDIIRGILIPMDPAQAAPIMASDLAQAEAQRVFIEASMYPNPVHPEPLQVAPDQTPPVQEPVDATGFQSKGENPSNAEALARMAAQSSPKVQAREVSRTEAILSSQFKDVIMTHKRSAVEAANKVKTWQYTGDVSPVLASRLTEYFTTQVNDPKMVSYLRQ